MTIPDFTPVAEVQFEKRDPSEFLPWMRCTETQYRAGKLLIVRPLKMIDDFRKLPEGADPSKWRGQLCVADIACLDPIDPAQDEQGAPLPGFPAGSQFRDNTIYLGYLNGAFKNYIGATCVGTVYTVPSGYAKPAVRWRDLSGDASAVQRARNFLISFPDFLIPRAAQITPMQQQAPQGHAAPVSGQPGGNAYGGGDPWAQAAPRAVSPAQQQHPSQGMSTLEQMRAAQNGAAGQWQDGEPPF